MRPVLIAGGGIAGLSLALALHRVGIASHILEARSEVSEAGAGIQIGPNGTRLLEQLGVAGRLAAVVSQPDNLTVRDARDGRVVKTLPLGAHLATRHGAPYWVVHRRDLQAALLAQVQASPGITLEAGFRVAGSTPPAAADRTASGGVAGGDVARGHADDHIRAISDDGRHRDSALLIGADGLWSTLRSEVAPGVTHPYSGKTAARSVMPIEAVPPALRAATVGLWLGPRLHVVHYPVEAGRSLAIVVIRERPSPGEGWGHDVAATEIAAALAGSAPALRELAAAFPTWREWALYEPTPLPRWSLGRVALIGDAAHPPLPFLAQGGVMAIEDAVVLADELAACLASGAATDGAVLTTALARYEARRRPRTQAVMAASRRNGRIYHLSGALALARNVGLALMPGTQVMAGYDWLYGWQPDRR